MGASPGPGRGVRDDGDDDEEEEDDDDDDDVGVMWGSPSVAQSLFVMEPQSLSCLSLKNRYGVARVKHYYYDDNGDTPHCHESILTQIFGNSQIWPWTL